MKTLQTVATHDDVKAIDQAERHEAIVIGGGQAGIARPIQNCKSHKES